MKKVLCLALAVILVLSVSSVAYAAKNPRIISIMPSLSFNGTTASCEATVVGNSTSEHINVTVKLWLGNTCLQTWTTSGYGYAHLSKTATVTSGRTYEMTVDVTINGVAQDTITQTRKCP